MALSNQLPHLLVHTGSGLDYEEKASGLSNLLLASFATAVLLLPDPERFETATF